jgi:hypothetical protein
VANFARRRDRGQSACFFAIFAVMLIGVFDKAHGAPREAAERIIEGTIAEYECGDNCYLTIVDSNQKQHVGLCAAPLCRAWNQATKMPDRVIGQRVKATVKHGEQLDGNGDVVGTFDAFSQIVLSPGGGRRKQ